MLNPMTNFICSTNNNNNKIHCFYNSLLLPLLPFDLSLKFLHFVKMSYTQNAMNVFAYEQNATLTSIADIPIISHFRVDHLSIIYLILSPC